MRKLEKPKVKTFDFGEQLGEGNEGESRFMLAHPKLVKKGKKEVDFEAPDGTWIELKTDSRKDCETENLFIEAYSDESRKVPGGPWQAYGKGADFFVYQFACGTEYWYPIKELIEVLESPACEGAEIRKVQNTRWSAVGVLIPKEWLKAIRVEKRWTE